MSFILTAEPILYAGEPIWLPGTTLDNVLAAVDRDFSSFIAVFVAGYGRNVSGVRFFDVAIRILEGYSLLAHFMSPYLLTTKYQLITE